MRVIFPSADLKVVVSHSLFQQFVCQGISIQIVDELDQSKNQLIEREKDEGVLLENFTKIFLKTFLLFQLMNEDCQKLCIKGWLFFVALFS